MFRDIRELEVGHGGSIDTRKMVNIPSPVFCLLVLNFRNWFTSVHLLKLPQARHFSGLSPSQEIKLCVYELRDKTELESQIPESF